MQEVSRAHSTRWKYKTPFGKEQIQRKKLNPNYIGGFIDGEGSFAVSTMRHKTLKRGIEISARFEIELRADDQEILERILITIGCGRIYDLSYERYGWYPHVKYMITSNKDLMRYLIPFLDKYPLQAKKAKSYEIFKKIVSMKSRKEHLTDDGYRRILVLREEMRKLGKKAKTFENR